jgi:hypothetical protein
MIVTFQVLGHALRVRISLTFESIKTIRKGWCDLYLYGLVSPLVLAEYTPLLADDTGATSFIQDTEDPCHP